MGVFYKNMRGNMGIMGNMGVVGALQKGYFQSKTNKINTTIEFRIF